MRILRELRLFREERDFLVDWNYPCLVYLGRGDFSAASYHTIFRPQEVPLVNIHRSIYANIFLHEFFLFFFARAVAKA